jgi:hypothetical protein
MSKICQEQNFSGLQYFFIWYNKLKRQGSRIYILKDIISYDFSIHLLQLIPI